MNYLILLINLTYFCKIYINTIPKKSQITTITTKKGWLFMVKTMKMNWTMSGAKILLGKTRLTD